MTFIYPKIVIFALQNPPGSASVSVGEESRGGQGDC